MSGFKGQLSFDATSADTLAASDLIGSIIRASGASVTSTLVAAKQALDVYLVNAIPIEVDLSHTSDSIQIGDGTDLLAINADGSLNVTINNTALTVSDISNGAIENTAKVVTTTSAALLSSQQTGRKDLWLQNRGTVNAFIGKTGVTTANGFEVQKGVSLEFRLGSAVSLHAVTATSTADFRLMEFAA